MPQYLVAIHHPDNFDPSTVTEQTMRDIGALNKEMMAAGVRRFAGGLQGRETKAKSLRAQPNGQVLVTDGPYLEAKEHVGGFWILEVADLDEAVAWGRKAVAACRTPVEVRPFDAPLKMSNPLTRRGFALRAVGSGLALGLAEDPPADAQEASRTVASPAAAEPSPLSRSRNFFLCSSSSPPLTSQRRSSASSGSRLRCRHCPLPRRSPWSGISPDRQGRPRFVFGLSIPRRRRRASRCCFTCMAAASC